MDTTLHCLHYSTARGLRNLYALSPVPPRMRKRIRWTLLVFGWSERSTTQPVIMRKILEYL